MTETEFMLTTIDNPFDPFDEFIPWRMFDIEKQHFCCEYLARIANVSDEMTQKEKNAEIERAIDEIIEVHPIKKWKKVSKEMEIEEVDLVIEGL